MVERKGWWKGICTLGVALAFTLLLFTLPAFAWWNMDWKYRRLITIQSDNALTDYQILVQLNSTNFDFSKANSDGSDIRFVDEDDATKLNYWIEEWDGVNESAKIWVNVTSIPVGEKTIYIYYNNSDAMSESNGSAVFEIFDDFEDNDLGTYNWIEDGGSFFSEVNGYLRSSGDGSSGDSIIYASSKLLPESYVAEYKCWVHGVGSLENYRNVNPGLRVVDGMNNRIDVVVMPAQDPNFHKVKDGTSVSEDLNIITGSTFRCCSEDVWHDVKVVVKGNNYKIYIDGELGIEFEDTKSDFLANSHWGFVFTAGSDEKNDEQRYDDLRIRKYTDPEPSVSVGAEELLPPPPIEVTYISPTTLQIKLFFTEKSGHIFIGTSPNKFTYAYEFHGSGTYTLTTTFLLPNETYYIKACDIDGNCTDVIEFTCSKKAELEKKNFTAPFNNLMQGGNLLNISKLGETIPSVYTSLLTDMFWAMFFGGIFLAYWIRQEDVMLPSIVGMISGVAMIGLLPPSAQHIAYILLVISIAGTLYTIIKARR